MRPTRLALAIRHVHFEDCGSLADVLGERGFEVRYVEPWREDFRTLDVATPELFVGLGGPVSVYEEDRYPWIADEVHLLERRLAARRPLLGICLGAQMLARVLGARVFAGPKELGWAPLQLTDGGAASVIAPLAGESTSMLHWHGDTFDLPAGATLLASTEPVAHQVYLLGALCAGISMPSRGTARGHRSHGSSDMPAKSPRPERCELWNGSATTRGDSVLRWRSAQNRVFTAGWSGRALVGTHGSNTQRQGAGDLFVQLLTWLVDPGAPRGSQVLFE